MPEKTTELHEIPFPNLLGGIKSVSTGKTFSALVDTEGTLYTWGILNPSSGSEEIKKKPEVAQFFKKRKIVIKEVSCLNQHAAVATEDGLMYIWGNNELNHFPALDSSRDVVLERPSLVSFEGLKVAQVKCGGFFTMTLTDDGTVWMNGANHEGYLGTDSASLVVAGPVPIAKSAYEDNKSVSIAQISAGWNHSLALSGEGVVYSWGRSELGRLGRKPLRRIGPILLGPRIALVGCGHNDSFALDSEGHLYGCGWNDAGQHGSRSKKAKRYMAKLGAESVRAFSAGSDHLVVLFENGRFGACGSNECNKLGINENAEEKLEISRIWHAGKGIVASAGFSHTIFALSQ